MKKTAIIIYPRVDNHSSRILKESKFLIAEKIVDQVLILSMYFDEKLEHEHKVSENILIKRLPSRFQKLPKNAVGDIIKFQEFIFRCKKIISQIKPTIISPHSVSVLTIGVWTKKKFNSLLVYDAHELETERYLLKGTRKKIAKNLELKNIGFCDKVVVVNESIATWYKKQYNLKNVYSVENIPLNPYKDKIMPKSNVLRKDLNISDNKIIFIYQGILSKGRGVPELLEIFNKKNILKDRVIVFMGYGEMVDEIKESAQINNQIFYKSAVKPSEILEYTSGADIGLFYILDKNLCLSYKMSLPNKFYEYTIAGLFVSVNDNFSLMSQLIKENHLGSVVKSDEKSLESFFNSITKSEIEKSLNESMDYRKSIDWSLNYPILNKIYKNA